MLILLKIFLAFFRTICYQLVQYLPSFFFTLYKCYLVEVEVNSYHVILLLVSLMLSANAASYEIFVLTRLEET